MATLSYDGNRLRTAIHLANRRIFRAAESNDDYSGMGTTIVGLLVNGSRVAIGHVGDSRLYLLRRGKLEQLTQDDSWAATILAHDPRVKPADLAHHPMRNVLTNVLGAREQVDVHLAERDLEAGDVLLLCSDGLHGVLDAGSAAHHPAGDHRRRRRRTRARRNRARARRRDNVTALVVRYEAERMKAGSAARIDVERLGRYRLLERIGGGATSVVFAAHDEAMDRQVALKMIVADLEDERKRASASIAKRRSPPQLLHRNIVTVLDVGEDQGHPYIVMELLDGLAARRVPVGAKPRRPLATKLDLITQLCAGLQAAHDVRRRPSRHQAEQPVRAARRRPEDSGLRPRAASGLDADRQRTDRRHARLHVARTGRRREGRRAVRHLLGGRRQLSDSHGPRRRSPAPICVERSTRSCSEDPAPMTDAEAPAAAARGAEQGTRQGSGSPLPKLRPRCCSRCEAVRP